MKTLIYPTKSAFRCWLLLLVLQSFVSMPVEGTQQNNPATPGDYAIVQRNPNSRVWQNGAGQRVTENVTGLHYWSGTEWVESDPTFLASDDGSAFLADHVQDPTHLAANLNCQSAVTVTTPQGVVLHSTPIAIGLYDAKSGQSVLIATLTNSTGVLADPSHVVYDKAFVGGGISASVVYSFPDTGSFHQDVVFTGFNKDFSPTNWGFPENATNTLQWQLFTEFYAPPQPEKKPLHLYIENDPNIRASMASPDLMDNTLDFGTYVFWPGRAHTTATANPPGSGAPILKDFVTSEGRTFLVESIPFRSIINELKALPPVTAKNSSPQHVPKARKTALAALSVPKLQKTAKATAEKTPPSKRAELPVSLPKGLAMDYIVVVSSTLPVLYASDTTYYVSGSEYDYGPVTIEGGAVFKYPLGSGILWIYNNEPVTTATASYRPAIFTAADDNTIGATLSTAIWSGYTGNPGTNQYGSTPLWLYAATNVTLNNLRFRYQYNGFAAGYGSVNQVITLNNCQFAYGDASAIFEPYSPLTLNVNNCLFADIGCPFQSHSFPMTVNACNCTFDSSTYLFYADGSWSGTSSYNATNCIFSSLTNEFWINTSSAFSSNNCTYNGFYSNATFGASVTSNGTSPYELVGAGNYYLPEDSSFLGMGTTNIPASLLTQLQNMTTYAPTIVTDTFTANTVLWPNVPLDNVGNALALGYHYAPIDFLASCAVSNCSLMLTNGVTVAYYNNAGIWLQDGSSLYSQGTPNSHNNLVYYTLVQEQPGSLSGVSNAAAVAQAVNPMPYATNNSPSIFLRLTSVFAPQGASNIINTADTNQVLSSLTLRDCEVYGSGASISMNESNHAPPVIFQNNLFHRTPFAINSEAYIQNLNDLFYGSTNSPGSITNTTVSIHFRTGTSTNYNWDCAYSGCKVSLDGDMTNNAYVNGATNSAYTVNDITNYALTWVSGPLGSFYQPSNSTLINAGNVTADQLGMYHYTTITNTISGVEIKETNSVLDIGYHYVALGTNGLPISTPGDTIP